MKKIMKKISYLAMGMLLVTIWACDDDHHYYDNTPPEPPTNIKTITGDNRVDIYWDANRERDLAGYNVYYSFSYDGRYELIGYTEETYFIDWDAQNGDTYYYAVTAYDFDGNESELSFDVVYDTPRPEGFNQAVFDYLEFPQTAGYDFDNYLVTPFNDQKTDFFFENYEGTFYLNVWDDTDIQDAGQTSDIYDVDMAPTNGWVPLIEGDNVKYVEAEVGHTYVVWTWDNHFAKVRISQITNERMVFDWAYQLVEGERQLKTSRIITDNREQLPDVVRKLQK